MYAYGTLELFSWTIVDNGSHEFEILKPVTISVVYLNSAVKFGNQKLVPGKYRVDHKSSTNTLSLDMFVGSTATNTWLEIDTFDAVTGDVDLICNYAEGVSALDDIDKIIA